MVQAEKIDYTKPNTRSHPEQYLWLFKDPEKKPKTVVGIKILR
jgi:hypothetical protein